MQRIMPMLMAFAFSAASAVAVAAERPGSGGYEQETQATTGTGTATAMPSFEEADKDGSGAVEISEATGISGLDMSAADEDNDGRLSRSEYEAAKKSHEEGTTGAGSESGGAVR